MKESGVYKLGFVGEDKVYIGSSSDLNGRFQGHKSALQQRKGENKRVQDIYDRLGKNSMYFEIIELCKKSDLLEREYFYINSLKGKVLNYKTRRNQLINTAGDCCCGEKIDRKEMNLLEKRCRVAAKKYFKTKNGIDEKQLRPNFVTDFVCMCTNCVAEEILEKYPYVKKCKNCGIVYFDDNKSETCTFCGGTEEGLQKRLAEHDAEIDEHRLSIGLCAEHPPTSVHELKYLIDSYYVYCLD